MTTEFTFTATINDHDSYSWDFGDGNTDNSGHQVSHTYSSIGTYSVKLTVTKDGEDGETSQSIYVYPVIDYGKVICSGSDQGHENSMKAIIEGIYPGATVITRIESFSNSVNYAYKNGYGIISRPTTGLSDSRIANGGDTAESWGVIPVHSHGSNSHVELEDPSYIGSIWAIRDNDGSYGDGVEFTIPDVVNESIAAATMAGYVSKFMDSYIVTVEDLRTIFRNTASNGGVFDKSNGYGTVDFNAVENEL